MSWPRASAPGLLLPRAEQSGTDTFVQLIQNPFNTEVRC